MGLADAGYGQYGARGTTPNGLKATLSKPKFTLDREENLKSQRENRTLKVYIERTDAADEEDEAVVKALVELYG
jgi:hypothetical protein